MKRHNLHTHSTWSDGQNNPGELIRRAIDEKYEVIGISDHGFTVKIRSLYSNNLPDYILQLERIKQNIGGIEIKAGLEIDTCKQTGTDPEKLPFQLLNNLDYVLFEYVRGIDEVDVFAARHNRNLRSILAIRNRLTIPVGLAHPDLARDFFGRDEELAKLLAENDIFVDMPLNSAGDDVRHRYSNALLDCLRRYGVKFAIGTDVHRRRDVWAIEPAIKYILENGLKVHEMVV